MDMLPHYKSTYNTRTSKSTYNTTTSKSTTLEVNYRYVEVMSSTHEQPPYAWDHC